MTEVIRMSGLSKRYSPSSTFALKDLSLSVKKGEVYGFIGPNGAGKSTTIKLLLNFIQPTSGSGAILGQDIVNDSVKIKEDIGYLSGEFAFYPKMTGRQLFTYLSELLPLKNKAYLEDLINRFKVDVNVPIRSLSKGNRQKIGIVQAFMHEPKVLILDEPTSGLDPLMQQEFFKLIDETKKRAAAVFLSSHNLSEVQKICDKAGFIREGKLIKEEVVAKLQESTKSIEVILSKNLTSQALNDFKYWNAEKTGSRSFIAHIKGDLSPFLKKISNQPVVGITQRETTIEEQFLHFYSEDSE